MATCGPKLKDPCYIRPTRLGRSTDLGNDQSSITELVPARGNTVSGSSPMPRQRADFTRVVFVLSEPGITKRAATTDA